MKKDHLRSDCPINFALENIGDKWTLLIIRDLIFEGKKFYKDFLNSQEGIATNILSKRLTLLKEAGIIESAVYENQRAMKVYSLTEKGKDLIPMMTEMILWSAVHGEGVRLSPEFLNKLQTNRVEVLAAIRSCIGTTAFSANQPDEHSG